MTFRKDLISGGITTRYKFDIIVGTQHFSFVRFFAMPPSERDHVVKPRSEIAALLREEHRAAWQRYHDHMRT